MASPNESKHQARALSLNENMVNRPPILAPQAPQTPLSAVAEDPQAEWSFSKDGGTGAMLVKTGVEASGGAAIKVEGKSSANNVMQAAKLMEVFFQNAQGDAPFNAPRVTRYGAGNEEALAELKKRLQDMHQNADPDRESNIRKQLESLEKVAAGNAAVIKMEFASGLPLNRLTTEDKAALLKTDQLGQTLGRATAVVMALQMKDHLGVDTGGGGFATNPTNLTFDPATGKLSLIDFDAQMNYIGDSVQDEPLARLGKDDLDRRMGALYDYQAEALSSPEAFESAVDDIASGRQTPFTMTLRGFTTAHDDAAAFLLVAEASIAENEITYEDKRRFAANLLTSSVDGLDYVKQNMTALRMAAATTNETMLVVQPTPRARRGQVPEEKKPEEMHVQHFYTENTLNALDQKLQSMDLQGLREKAALRMAEMEQSRKHEVQNRLSYLDLEAGQLQAAVSDLDKRIEKLQAGTEGVREKLKAAYRGRDGMIEELQTRKQAMKGRMDDIRRESASLMNTEAFNDAMKQQAAVARERAALQQQAGIHAEGQQNQAVLAPDPELVANVPNHLAPPAAKLEKQGADANNQPDPEAVVNLPNGPAQPPPGQGMSKQPKTRIGAKAKDAGDGMPISSEEKQESPEISQPDAEWQPLNEPPAPSRRTLSDEQIDKHLDELFPHEKIAEEKQQDKDYVPDYRTIADKISNSIMVGQADNVAMQVRMIETREIKPLKEQIIQAEQEFLELEQTPGNERFEAKKAELYDLHMDLDNWEVRVETLKAAMNLEDPRQRVTAIKLQQKGNVLEDQDDLALERRNLRLQLTSAKVAGELIPPRKGDKVREIDIDLKDVTNLVKQKFVSTYVDKSNRGVERKLGGATASEAAEIDPIIDMMQPKINEVNEIQKEIRDLVSNRDTIEKGYLDQFNADPSLISDASLRQTVVDSKKGMDQADKRILHSQNKIEDLKKTGLASKAKAFFSKNTEFYEEELNRAQKEFATCKGKLDSSLRLAVNAAVEQDPDVASIYKQVDERIEQQVEILAEYKDEVIAQVKSRMPELLSKQNNQNIVILDNNVASNNNVKSILKKREETDPLAREAAQKTAQNANNRAERDKRLKLTVKDQLSHGIGDQQPDHKAEVGSLRADWKSPVKRESSKKPNAPTIGKH